MIKNKCFLRLNIASFLFLPSCAVLGSKPYPFNIYIGETKTFRTENTKEAKCVDITNLGRNYQQNQEGNYSVYWKVSLVPEKKDTFFSESEISFASRKEPGTSSSNSNDKPYQTQITMNIEKNGFDIFSTGVSEETFYTFCFDASVALDELEQHYCYRNFGYYQLYNIKWFLLR